MQFYKKFLLEKVTSRRERKERKDLFPEKGLQVLFADC
jgi:hypothetical protein